MTPFQHIRLELAREPGHPAGDPGRGYDIVAALDGEGRLDAAVCRSAAEHCRVRAFENDHTVATGRLAHGPGGRWSLHFEAGPAEDATGHHFRDERFVPVEYVSLTLPDGEQHTYMVASVQPL